MAIQPLPDVTDAPNPLANLRLGSRTYVVEPLKILYISAPKNVCTSLRWMLTELAGEDPRNFHAGLTPRLHAEDAIHRRPLFQRTPRLSQIDPQVRRTIHPDNGWFVFAAVRDPRSRLFSAWQNKFLMQTPDFRQWREADWYPALPDSAEDIARDFARFVDFIRAEPDHPVAQNGHFKAQTHLIRPDVVPYSRIYDVSEMPALLADLADHLRTRGVEHDLTLRRTNETPLRANGRVFAEPVRSRIEQIYAVDFETFGHMWDYGKIENAGDWTPSSVQELRARALLHDRIGELLARARVEWRRAEAAEQRAELAGQRAARAEQRTTGAQKRSEQDRLRADRANKRIAELESMRSTRVGLAARRMRGRLRELAREPRLARKAR